WNVDSQYWTNRELCYPKYVESAARMAYKMARIENPRRSLDFAEVYWQLKGEAGKRQIKNKAERGLAQAWGDLLQAGTVITMKR
ncbi:MAG: hypothetical protein ABSA72_12280, partial [Nitrososphaerales archaeon]